MVNLNPSLEAQKNLNQGLEAQENQGVEKIEIEEVNPSLETRIKKNKMKGTYGSKHCAPLTPPSGEPTVPSIQSETASL